MITTCGAHNTEISLASSSHPSSGARRILHCQQLQLSLCAVILSWNSQMVYVYKTKSSTYNQNNNKTKTMYLLKHLAQFASTCLEFFLSRLKTSPLLLDSNSISIFITTQRSQTRPPPPPPPPLLLIFFCFLISFNLLALLFGSTH